MPVSKRPVALVTGSGRHRVGNVVARDLAAAGLNVAIHYHQSADAARESVEQLGALGVEAVAYQANVADERDVARMFEKLRDKFGRLDLLVTTASIWKSRSFEETSVQDIRDHFDVNCLGTLLCAREAGAIMCQQDDGGAIVTIGDWAIERPYPDHLAYFVSKGAIPTLTRALAVELAGRNPRIRVNCIHPGPVMFPPGLTDQEKEELVQATLVKTADCPQSISQAVRFFYENPFVTGTCLPVDGGRSIFAQGESGTG